MSRKKILFLTTSYPRFKGDHSGDFIRTFCERISETFDCFVIAPDDFKVKSKKNNKIQLLNFTYFYPRSLQTLCYRDGIVDNIRSNYFNVLLVPFFIISLYFKSLKQADKVNIIHSHWIFPCGLVGAILSKKLKKKHIITIHSGGLFFLSRLPFRVFIIKFIYKYSDHIVCVSEKLRKELLSYTMNDINISVLPMGVELSDIESSNFTIEKSDINRPFRILFMGRLIKIKGVEILIRAVSLMNNVALYIAGDGNLKNELKELAKQLMVSVRFPGFISGNQKTDILKLCDVVVVPSIELKKGRSEGMPIVILEAFKHSKPVIGSNTGGIQDVIKHNVNGLIFESRNSTMLANQLKELQSDSNLLKLLGQEARKTAEYFDVEKCAHQYNDIYDKVFTTNKYVNS
jgi:glycosyltransferase involved in cell wall biosynthesis